MIEKTKLPPPSRSRRSVRSRVAASGAARAGNDAGRVFHNRQARTNATVRNMPGMRNFAS